MSLTDTIKNSLYNAVSKYQYEIHRLEDSRQDVARIIAIAKKLGFVADHRNKYGTNEIVLLYKNQWYVSFYNRSGSEEISANINEYELLTGQALQDYKEHQEAEARAEIDADRRMSLYNSGYRDF